MSTSDLTSRQSGGQIAMKSENTNCLSGMQCPKCGSLEPFGIEVTMVVTMSDDGTEDYGDCSGRTNTANAARVIFTRPPGISEPTGPPNPSCRTPSCFSTPTT